MAGPIERSLEALDERRLLTGIYVVRLSMAIALALTATVVRSSDSPASPISVVLLIVGVPLAWTAVSLLLSRRSAISRRFFTLQFGHDLFLVTTAVVLTGGVGSEFAYMYVLLIAVGGLILGMGGAVLIAFGSMVAYLGVAYVQIEPQFAGAKSTITLPNLSAEAATVLWSLALIGAVFLIVGVASGLAARRLGLQRTRLVELERQLAHARIDAQDLLNTLESGILSIDASEEVDFVNYTARVQLGISDTPRPTDLRERAESAGMRELYDLMVGTLRSEKEVDFMELKLPAGAGAPRPFSVSTTILYGPGGEKRGAAAILKNIEDVKRLEDLARQADRHKAVAELAAGLAHEIRNPLAAIRSSVELLAGDEEDGGDGRPGEDRRLLGLIVREADRLSSLIQDFMAFSRTELRSRGRIDLVEVVRDALEVERMSAPESAQDIEFAPPDEEYWVEGDHNLLKQVVINLATNARAAVGDRPAGRVEVRIGVEPDLPGLERAPGPLVVLEVRDNGPGVDPRVRDRIFDPFFTTRETGFGMGLAIVHRIVNLHGGVVWVHSTPGWGSIFRIALPRIE
ncbi:MAG TPA: ATP-binding protein [Gemmatimonadota bacterium]|jgi:two-component system sensor histidine kinase PilS (NtrC family)